MADEHKTRQQHRHRQKQRLLKMGLPIAVVVLGVLIAFWLTTSGSPPQQAQKQARGLLVETVVAERREHRLDVHAQGTVVPARQVQVQPQVSGKVVSVHPQLVPGGLIREGQQLFRIDPADYELAVEQSQTQLEEARSQLDLELGRQDVAESEWQLFEEQFNVPGQRSELALREPQLEAARAQVQRAEAALKQARLQLQRSSVEAPFHSLVVEEAVDEGQLVQPQQVVARLVGAEEFWVRVYVPPDKIAVIDIPGVNARTGSPASVLLDLGEIEQRRYQGQVRRLEGSLDARSRMAQLIVSVEDPLGQLTTGREPASPEFPLLLDAYVDVVIQGDQAVSAIAVPREAVHEGNRVYLYDDGELSIRTLKVIWEREEEILAGGGLEEGARIITTGIPSPVEGLALRLAQEAETEITAADSGAQNSE